MRQFPLTRTGTRTMAAVAVLLAGATVVVAGATADDASHPEDLLGAGGRPPWSPCGLLLPWSPCTWSCSTRWPPGDGQPVERTEYAMRPSPVAAPATTGVIGFVPELTVAAGTSRDVMSA